MTRKTKRWFVDIASLAFNFSVALVAYFLSTFASSIVGDQRVDFLFAISGFGTLLLLSLLVRLMTAIGRGRTTVWAAVVYFGSLILLASPMPRPVLVGVFALYQISLLAVLVGLDVVLEKYSNDEMTGRIRGRHLAILNLGWIAAPWVAGSIMATYGFVTLALLSALFALPVICILAVTFYGRGVGMVSREQGIFQSFQLLWGKRPLRYAFAIAFLLQVFYAIMVIETPLVLRGLGFTPGAIGLMFTIMLLPFVLVQYPLGRLADRFGEKEIVTAGFTVAGLATLGIAWISGTALAVSFFFWTVLLFFSRVGAASIEVMRDSYFFKHVDSRDLHVIALLWSMMPLAYLIAPLLSNTIVRSTGAFPPLFGALGLFLLIFAGLATRMPDTK